MPFQSHHASSYTVLVEELVEVFTGYGYAIEGARLEADSPTPAAILNRRFGDMEDRVPDVLAFDNEGKRVIIGMVCTGGEIGSDETLTKFNVFLNIPTPEKEKPALLFVMVPASRVAEATDVITHHLHPEYWETIQIVASRRVT